MMRYHSCWYGRWYLYGAVGHLVECRTFCDMEVRVQSLVVAICAVLELDTLSPLLQSTHQSNGYHAGAPS